MADKFIKQCAITESILARGGALAHSTVGLPVIPKMEMDKASAEVIHVDEDSLKDTGAGDIVARSDNHVESREHDLSERSGDEYEEGEYSEVEDFVDTVGQDLDDVLTVNNEVNQEAVAQVMTPRVLGPRPSLNLSGVLGSAALPPLPQLTPAPSTGPVPSALAPSQGAAPVPAVTVAASAASAAIPASVPGASAPGAAVPAKPPVHPAIAKRVRVKQEQTAPEFEPSIAELITDTYDRANLEPKTLDLEALYKTLPRPDNLPVLTKTEINPEIFPSLSLNVTKRDKIARSAQHAGVRTTSGLIIVLRKLLEIYYLFKRADMPLDVQQAYGELPQLLIDGILDAITCLGYLGNRINTLRRVLLRPQLQFSFRFLCDRPVASYATLFGDDLEAIIKQVTDNRKTASTIVMRPRQGRKRSRKQFQGGRGGRGGGKRFLGEYSSISSMSKFACLIDDFNENLDQDDARLSWQQCNECYSDSFEEQLCMNNSIASNGHESLLSESLFVRSDFENSDFDEFHFQAPSMGQKRGGAGHHVGTLSVSHAGSQCECYICSPPEGRGRPGLTPAAARSGERQRRRQNPEPRSGPQEPAAQIQEQLKPAAEVGKVNFLDISPVLCINQGDFVGGILSRFLPRWRRLTRDPEILQFVTGTPLNFVTSPIQRRLPHEIVFPHNEATLVKRELDKFLSQDIVEKSVINVGDYCSNLFTRPKKTPGSIRLILSLKSLNKFVKYIHFKMETLQTVLLLLKPGDFMTSIDLSQSFYHVKVREADQKYLKFLSLGQIWAMKVLPMGYRDSPRVFTRLMKVPMQYLRSNLGVLCSHFIDDVITLSPTRAQAVQDTGYTGNTLSFCGFHINLPKSVTDPTQLMGHLGFNVDSVNMTLHILTEKAEKLVKLAQKLLAAPGGMVCIRQVAQFVGTCIAACPALEYGPFHTKELEISKTKALNANGWNFDGSMTLSQYDMLDIEWWQNNIRGAFSPILSPPVDWDIYSDASGIGWGGYCQQSNQSVKGMFGSDELDLHINCKELLACFLTVQTFLRDIFGAHVHLHIDNQVALGCIRAQGSTRSPLCNKFTAKILRFFEGHKLHLTTTFIQSSCNVEADAASRKGINDDIEWEIAQSVFDLITNELQVPEVDLFANRLNNKVPKYVSWFRDPGAIGVDALHFDWTKFHYMYAFVPFSLIPRLLSKLQRTPAAVQLLVVLPLWPGQIWWTTAMDLVISPIFVLPPPQEILSLPHRPSYKHPMNKLTLIAVKLSTCKILQACYHQQLQPQCLMHEQIPPMLNIKLIGRGGCYLQHRSRKIPISLLGYTQ